MNAPLVTRTERGWGGHFICADRCLYRRNTLLECGERRFVVSSVGAMRKDGGGFGPIGAFDRYYETMAFEVKREGLYWEADVQREVPFESEWSICATTPEQLPSDVDNQMDRQHEAVVAELSANLAQLKEAA